MNDEIFDRIYQAGRDDLNSGIDRLLKRISRSTGDVFRAYHRIEFDAPWSKRTRGPGRA